MKTHIIYIPGLGDRYDPFRRRALSAWGLWSVTAEHVPIVWYDGASMASKLDRIEAAIGRAPSGSRIVLIGESAGGTLVLRYASDARISRIITLCGVAQRSTPISPYLRRRAPALDEAVAKIPEHYTVDIHAIRAVIDGVVGRRYSTANGATAHTMWTVGHLSTIALCLTIFAPIVTAIAKKQK